MKEKKNVALEDVEPLIGNLSNWIKLAHTHMRDPI